MALTGYKPNFKFLEKLGVNLSDDGKKIPEYNVETMESNVNGLYLAGVICGGMETHKWFIENSRVHAKMIIKNISAQGKNLEASLRGIRKKRPKKVRGTSLRTFKSRLSSKKTIN